MGYDIALKEAWKALDGKSTEKRCVKFISDEYEVDLSKKTIFSLSCNIEAKDYYKILILHYLANEDKVASIEGDAWISFKEMDGGK